MASGAEPHSAWQELRDLSLGMKARHATPVAHISDCPCLQGAEQVIAWVHQASHWPRDS